MGTQDKGSTLH